jgi:hypothetical protein
MRNLDRFPDDFMFDLSQMEFDILRTQIATSKRGGMRYAPFAFTEQGVAMLNSVLNSDKAIEVNILYRHSTLSCLPQASADQCGWKACGKQGHLNSTIPPRIILFH